MKLIHAFLISLIVGWIGLPCTAMDRLALRKPLLSDLTDSDGSHSRGDSGDSSASDEQDAKQRRQAVDEASSASFTAVNSGWKKKNIVATDAQRDRGVHEFRPWISLAQGVNGDSIMYIPCRLRDVDAKKMGAKNKGYLTDWYIQKVEHDSATEKVATSIEQMPTQFGQIRSFVALPNVNMQVWIDSDGVASAYPLTGWFRSLRCIGGSDNGRARSLIAISDHEIAIGRDTGIIEIWDMQNQSGKLSRQLALSASKTTTLRNPVIALAFLKTKNALVSCAKGARSSSIHVWDLRAPRATSMHTVSDTPWNHIKPTDDGNAIIVVSANGRLSMWDTQTGDCLLSKTVKDQGLDWIGGLQLRKYSDTDNPVHGDEGIVPHSVEPLDNHGMVALVNGGCLQTVHLSTAAAIERDVSQTNYNIYAIARTKQGRLVTTANARTVTLWESDVKAKAQSEHREAMGD